MKRICLILIGLLIATFSINLNAKNEKSKQEKRIEKAKKRLAKDKYLNSMYTIDDKEELKIQKILEFPGYSKEQLTEFVKNYLSNRIERQKQNTNDFTGNAYDNVAISVSESVVIHLESIFYPKTFYTLKTEIKDSKIRITVLITSILWGYHHVESPDFYPYRWIGSGKKFLKKFARYVEESILNDMQTNLVKIHEDRTNDDW